MAVAHTIEQEEQNLREILMSGRAPGMSGFSDRGIALSDERVYRQHNITHTVKGRDGIKATPNAPHMQCQCGNCGSHRNRSAVTGVAAPGKEI